MRAALAFVALVGAVQNSHGADDIADFLARDWYETEVIVFQRSPVMEMNSTERLITLNAPPFPNGLRAFVSAPDQIGVGYDLDPLTRATLEFPVIRQTRFNDAESAPAGGVASRSAQPLHGTMAPPTIHPVLEPNPLLEFMDVVARFEKGLEQQSYRWLPETQFLMSRDAYLIERQGDAQVLLHGRWLQPVPPREEPEPLLIQAGMKLPEHYQLEGSMAVTLGRFLHFHAQLSYREPGMGQRPIGLAVNVNELARSTPLPAPVPGYMVLDQRRRMRSKEIHYIDHPKLGIIIRIDPVAFPEDLIADFEALQESTE